VAKKISHRIFSHTFISTLSFKKTPKGSRKNKFTFLALGFSLGLVDFEEQKAL